jgi:hypothetical protein
MPFDPYGSKNGSNVICAYTDDVLPAKQALKKPPHLTIDLYLTRRSPRTRRVRRQKRRGGSPYPLVGV